MKDIAPQTDTEDNAVARKLAALAHPVRLRLLRDLGAADCCCVKDLVGRAGLAQSTISQHLKVLAEAELISFRAERQCSYYAINAEAVRELAAVIGQTLDHCCAGVCGGFEGESVSYTHRPADACMRPVGHKDD